MPAATDELLSRAAEFIRAGRLVAFPTETVYGLGANALDEGAVRRIYEAKGRPAASPLIVHVDSEEMVRSLVERWPDEARALTSRYWPGPLTLVLEKQPRVPDIVTAGLATVGLRMPAHPLALELIRRAGVPLAAPSANRFSQLSPTTAAHVRESLGTAVDLVLDGGPTTVGIESTVLSLAGGRRQLLRPGMISLPEIEAEIGPVEPAGRIENSAHPSPGMHRRHYSPRTPLLLVDRGEALPPGRGVFVSVGQASASRFPAVEMPADPPAYAARLYGILHELDGQGLDWIAVERPPETAAWTAIRDRLERAAAPRG